MFGTEWALSILKFMPFSLEIFLDYFSSLKVTSSLKYSVFSYSVFLALEPPGLILCCFTMCFNFWEFPSSFIFPTSYDYVFTLQEPFCSSECSVFPFNNILFMDSKFYLSDFAHLLLYFLLSFLQFPC